MKLYNPVFQMLISWKGSKMNFPSALAPGRLGSYWAGPVSFTLCPHAWREPSKCLLRNENEVFVGTFELDFEMLGRHEMREKEFRANSLS